MTWARDQQRVDHWETDRHHDDDGEPYRNWKCADCIDHRGNPVLWPYSAPACLYCGTKRRIKGEEHGD